MLKKFIIGGATAVGVVAAVGAVVFGLAYIGSLLVPLVGPEVVAALAIGLFIFVIFGTGNAMFGED